MGISLRPSMPAVFKLTGFPPILKLTENEALNPSTVRHCKHPEVMMTVPVSLNSRLALFFQVYKGEFQLPEFLKEKPQVLYLLPLLNVIDGLLCQRDLFKECYAGGRKTGLW